jgi:RIO kinase 1
MEILHQAGCDVPIPFTRGHNAILMSYIGDLHTAAPTLNTVTLQKSKAVMLFDRVLHNMDLMLSHSRVHGDLSAYNLLFWQGNITFIDFPQAINPNRNPNAYPIFQRDMRRICEYFRKQGVDSDPLPLAEDMWVSHGYSTLPNFLPKTEEPSQD